MELMRRSTPSWSRRPPRRPRNGRSRKVSELSRRRICVGFWPGGRHFQVPCEGRVLHLSELQTIDEPPSWWTARFVGPVESITTCFVDED